MRLEGSLNYIHARRENRAVAPSSYPAHGLQEETRRLAALYPVRKTVHAYTLSKSILSERGNCTSTAARA